MKTNTTELVMILDKSGSMYGLEADTIGGFNSMIEKQRREEGKVLVSAVLFNERSDVIYDRIDLEKVEPMTERQYSVSGCTALLDAVGDAIHHIGNVHKYARRQDVPDRTVFMITTDGMENASRRYTYDSLKRLVEKQKEKYGWEFIFMGANMDAIETAGRFGIAKERAATYRCDSEGTAINFEVMSEIVHRVRSSSSHKEMKEFLDDAELMAPIRAHCKK